MVSRAFGDAHWKMPLSLQEHFTTRYGAPGPPTRKYEVSSSPYLTAEPVVTASKIDLGRPWFLIMATYRLWDTVSSEQAVNLVGKWLTRKGKPVVTERMALRISRMLSKIERVLFISGTYRKAQFPALSHLGLLSKTRMPLGSCCATLLG